jgi:hypothetical protein
MAALCARFGVGPGRASAKARLISRAGMFRVNELECLFRDARCGRFHPANTFLTHEIVGKTPLGIDLDEALRWG